MLGGMGLGSPRSRASPPTAKSQLSSKGREPAAAPRVALQLSLSVNVSFSLLALDVTVFPSQQREAQK